MEITKREVLFSTIIAAVLLTFGFVIHGKISDSLIEKYQKYDTAVQIDNDPDLFRYGMETDIGFTFAYGDLKAVDTVTYDEIGGQYSYVKKVKQRHTMHTRKVTRTRTVKGAYPHIYNNSNLLDMGHNRHTIETL